MPHAHHFLERLDRVDRAQTEFALSLYNDHEAVAFVLGHVNLPEGDGRVALEVGASSDGPVVVVTRDGHFVTCLGAGMRHDHPVVPKKQLVALLAKAAERRSRREMMQKALRPDEDEGDLFQRIFTRGSRLCREDFRILTAFEPMLGLAPFAAMLDGALEVLKTRAALSPHALNSALNPGRIKALRKLHDMEWGVAHLTLLSGAADRKQLDTFLGTKGIVPPSASLGCSIQGGVTFYLRAAWMIARFGKTIIPPNKTAFLNGTAWMTLLDAGMGLAALAIRHTGTHAEVRRIFEGYGPPLEKPATTEDSRVNVAAGMLGILDDPEGRVLAALTVGRRLCVGMSSHLPEGHPRRYATEESVPDDLARTAALAFDGDMNEPIVQSIAMLCLPTAARAAAEDFYFPREIVKAWMGPWAPEETLERLQRVAKREPKKVPVRATDTPGRNDPCSCGSGKKWKKCHGGAEA